MKIYEVTFLEYTNPMKNTVKDKYDNYLDATAPFLIKECDITNVAAYGKGIKELKYVGTLTELTNLSSEHQNFEEDDISLL